MVLLAALEMGLLKAGESVSHRVSCFRLVAPSPQIGPRVFIYDGGAGAVMIMVILGGWLRARESIVVGAVRPR